MKTFKFSVLVILLSTLTLKAPAQTCSDLFRVTSFVTETQLLKAAEKSVLSDLSLSEKARKWATGAFRLLHLNRNYREQVDIERTNRNYKETLLRLDVEVSKDPRFLIAKYKPYLETLLAVALNGSANYMSYRYVGAYGFVVYLPGMRLFNPRTIPTEVIDELSRVGLDEAAPKTKAYILSRVRHGGQILYESVRSAFNIGMISSLILFHSEMITDPANYMVHQVDHLTAETNKIAYKTNEELIASLQASEKKMTESNQIERISAIESLIDSLSQQNKEIASEIKL